MVSSDELREQRAIVLDGRRRIDRPQDRQTSWNLELDEGRLERAAV